LVVEFPDAIACPALLCRPHVDGTDHVISNENELEAALRDGGTVHCDGAKTIPLSHPVTITRPCRIVGGHFSRDTGVAFEITSSDVELDGLHVTGGGQAAGYDSTQHLIFAHGTAEEPLTNVCVRGCTLRQSRADNVWLEWCTDSHVAGNDIESYLYSGVMVISGQRVVITENRVRDAPLSTGVVNTYGIALTDLANTAEARSRDCTIVGNQVSLVDWEGIDTHGGDDLTITGNSVTGCPRGIALVTGNETRVVAPTNIAVSGNTINAAGARKKLLAGVFLGGIANVPASATIVGNQFTGYPTPFITTFWNRGETYIGNNSDPLIPWSAIQMGADYTADPNNPPRYLVDGNTVHLRGAVVPKDGGVSTRTDVGRLAAAAAWPTVITTVAFIKGADPTAGTAQLVVTTDGHVQLLHGAGTDTDTYSLAGSYRVP
jgi:parallel beta helix pectate lyase-like protein